jgi:para-nitrobenzyl esterase
LHNLDSIARKWEPSDRRLEKEISAYWIRFVKTGDPNGMDLPVWKPFTDQDPQCMIFEESSIPARLPGKEALDFLYSHYPGRP